MQGTIKRLAKEKGFGFIESKGQEYFFHMSGLKNVRFDELYEGQEVTFEDVETPKGQRAEDIYI
jgi:CspA family cold shock protein